MKYGTSLSLAPHPVQEWSMQLIKGITRRRYEMCHSAIEIYFIDNTSILLAFETNQKRKHFISKIDSNYNSSRANRIRINNAKQKWLNREISNMEYLMTLNDCAGRNYHDMAQYPVFPWVLRNYKSDSIDLNLRSNYRDLSKPVGVQNDAATEKYKRKYAQTKDMYEAAKANGSQLDGIVLNGFPRHYATHYSSPHSVIWYLSRVEPFASLAIELHDGSFDKPDRQFLSVEKCWESCASPSCETDVKELIPEMFYLPEMFENINRFKFGTTQNGVEVNHVELPPWANNSPDQFVQIHRQALESEYVSMNLHAWIDLIFGFKQRGPYLKNGSNAAEEACNVYFHLAYENAVDAEKLKKERPDLFHLVRNVVNNFGQTPSLLFRRPHPRRDEKKLTIYRMFNRKEYKQFPPILVYKAMRVCEKSIGFIHIEDELLVIIDATRRIGFHKWKTLDPEIDPPFIMQLNKNKNILNTTVSEYNGRKERVNIYSSQYGVIGGDMLFSCGRGRSATQVIQLSLGKVVHTIEDEVKCLTTGNNYLITGSTNCSIIIWDIMNYTPKHVLVGHDGPITALSAQPKLDTLISASEDGTVIVYNFQSGEYIRTIMIGSVIEWAGLSPTGNVVTYQEETLNLYNLNGKLLGTIPIPRDDVLTSIAFNENGNYLITGGRQGILRVYGLYAINPLQEVESIQCESSITAIYYTEEERHLLIGLSSGVLQVRALDNKYLRDRLKNRLQSIGL